MADAINTSIAKWLLDTSHTKSQLADELGITPATLTNKLQGETKWYWREVCQLADYLGVNLNDLRG